MKLGRVLVQNLYTQFMFSNESRFPDPTLCLTGNRGWSFITWNCRVHLRRVPSTRDYSTAFLVLDILGTKVHGARTSYTEGCCTGNGHDAILFADHSIWLSCFASARFDALQWMVWYQFVFTIKLTRCNWTFHGVDAHGGPSNLCGMYPLNPLNLLRDREFVGVDAMVRPDKNCLLHVWLTVWWPPWGMRVCTRSCI